MDSVSSRSTASVLAELRWDDGYAVPVANAENKALEDEVSAGLRPGRERNLPPAGGPGGLSRRAAAARGAEPSDRPLGSEGAAGALPLPGRLRARGGTEPSPPGPG